MPTPATVEIWESNGAGETPTKATNLNFGSADLPNLVTADHPLVIPVSGSVYSYGKFTRFKLVAWVDTNLVDNLKWWKSSGTNASGWTEDNLHTFNYTTPSRTFFNGFGAWPTTAGSAVGLPGSFANPTTGYGASYVKHQIGIDSTVIAGLKGSHTVTYQYDES